MRTFTTLIILLCAGLLVHSQSTENPEPVRKNIIGIDATSFLAQFTFGGYYDPLSYPYLNPGPYILEYKRQLGKPVLRLGLGGNLDGSYEKDGPNSSTDSKRYNAYTDMRAGLEWQNKLSKRWQFNYGLDILGGYLTGNSVDIVRDTSEAYAYDTYTIGYSIGGGPVLGITFHLTSRMMLSTESTLYYHQSTEKTKYDYYNTPSFTNTRISIDNNISIQYPLFIYFEFAF